MCRLRILVVLALIALSTAPTLVRPAVVSATTARFVPTQADMTQLATAQPAPATWPTIELPANMPSDFPRYVPGQVIIKFKSHATPSDKAAIEQDLHGRTLRKLSRIDAELLAVEGVTVEEAITRYKAHGKVEYIEPNYIVRASILPNDPLFDQLWAMKNVGQRGGTYDADIDADEAWDIGTGSQTVLVGVLDTGVDYRHPDLTANMWWNSREISGNGRDDDQNGYVDDVRGWDFCNDDNDPMDDHGHGTHLSGTIGAVGNDSVGVVGVCWRVKIVPIKFLNSKGDGTEADAIVALEYAAAVGVRIVNCSWGDTDCSQAFRDAVADAYAAGMLLIASAGNRQQNTDVYPQYPACLDAPNVVSVAATNHQDNLAWFSNWGPATVDLGAPGIDILSTLPGNSYGLAMGTSMAAPHVTGVAALVWSLNPAMSVDAVKARLLDMADPVPGLAGRCLTGARLNAATSAEGPDNIPPEAVRNLVTTSSGSNTMQLSWIATGDDGRVGTASRYEVRYSELPITEENFFAAARAWSEPAPQPYGSHERMEVRGLACNTTYYFTVRAYDNRGNESPISDLAVGTTLGAPDVRVWPESLSVNLLPGRTGAQALTVGNMGEGTLDFAVTGTHVIHSANTVDELAETGRLERDDRAGRKMSKINAGHDAVVYHWTDSDEPGGPSFSWVDITSVGTQVPMSGDDVSSGPYPIGFEFQFYGNTFSTFRVCTNGFLSFTSSGAASSNVPLPGSGAPRDLIAAWWDNLYVGEGQVYYFNDGTRLIVEFSEVTGSGSGGPYTFEVILYPTGTIVLQYLTMAWPWISGTVGIQNSDGMEGLQVVCDGPYMHDNLAISFAAMPKWLVVTPASGVVPPGGKQILTAEFSAAGLEGGDYSADIVVSSNDPDETVVVVPSRLRVTATPDIAVGGEVVEVRSTQAYARNGASTTHVLSSTVPALVPGLLVVEVAGDYGDSSECAGVSVEGAALGSVGSGGGDCGTLTREFALDLDRLDDLLADGKVNVTVQNSSDVDALCSDSRHTVVLAYRGPAEALDFGNLLVGFADTMTISVWNLGTAVLDLASVSTDDPLFSYSTSSRALAPGTSALITVVFTASVPGRRTGTLSIESNDPDESQIVVALLGEGRVWPKMEVASDSLLEELRTGQTVERHVAIVNGGGSDLKVRLSVRDVMHSGQAGALRDVLIVQNDTPWYWMPQMHRTVLEWAGLSYDVILADWLSAANLDRYRFVLMSSDQTSLFYSTMTAHRLKLEAYLTRGGVIEAHCSEGPNRGDPSKLVLPGGVTVSHRHDETANVVLLPEHPLAEGVPARFGSTHVSLRDVPKDAQIVVMGENGKPTVIDYKFGAGTLLATTLAVEIGFHNGVPNSYGRILMNMVACAERLATATWLSVSPDSGTVAPGDSLLVCVRFNGVSSYAGDYYGDIVVSGNDPVSASAVVPTCLRVAAAPDFVCASTNVDFDTVCVGLSSAGQGVTVKNVGVEPLSVTHVESSNPEFAVDAAPFVLQPFTSRDVTVTFAPSVAGQRSGGLTLRSDDPDNPEVVVLLSGTGVVPPDIRVTPASLAAAVRPGVPGTTTLRISNAGGQELSFTVAPLLGKGVQESGSASEREYKDVSPVDEDLPQQRAEESGGGPDAFGYRWVDSDQPGGPLFRWVDITSVGTQIPMSGDDVSSGPYPIDFGFPFYGTMANTFRVCTNGFISFMSASASHFNRPLPSAGPPEDLIAAWWTDLHFSESKAYYYNDGTRLIIEYQNVQHRTSNGTYTFEIILYPTGTIVLQYLNMSGVLTGATVGMQNAGKNAGLQMVYNAPYMHDSLAVKLWTTPVWLRVTPSSGVIKPGAQADLAVTFNPGELEEGEYSSSMTVSSNDPFDPLVTVPARMAVRLVNVADLGFDPGTLNLNSNGKWVTGYLELPTGYDPASIKIETVMLESTVPADPGQHSVGDYDRDGVADLALRFPRQMVLAVLPDGERVPVTVSGEVGDVAWFIGTDTIRVVRPQAVTSPGPETPVEQEGRAVLWGPPDLSDRDVLFRVAPNPAVAGVAIRLNLPSGSWVSVKIVNAAGAVVTDLADGWLRAGRHNIAWTGRGRHGEKLAPGVYFCAVKIGESSATKKILLVR